MYTTEDIENLAEFQYLAACQEMLFGNNSQEFEGEFIEWKDISEGFKDVWRAVAKISTDFLRPKLLIDFATPEGKELVRELHEKLHK